MNNFNFFLHQGIDEIKVKSGLPIYDLESNILRLTTQKIRILCVVDGAVQITENGPFGIGRLVKLLRNQRVGCTEFIVDIATRKQSGQLEIIENPAVGVPKFHNYRFDSEMNDELILDQYHELFLFGFAPGNSPGPDENIFADNWYTSDEELLALDGWMARGGGIFATGDHDYLGASMCHRIPRVGSMRKWTVADGVPPNSGPTRIDTVRPSPSAQNGIESDHIPQNIEWVSQREFRSRIGINRYPHQILCHPTHGIINVMPDHQHEGCCNEIQEIDLNANKAVGRGKEYPTINGIRPIPKIIAYGNVRGSSNNVNARRFPMISVYDGRENNDSDLGRVVVDSTWHHWFNLNILNIENHSNKTNWEKISRYFINIAIWIAPKNVFRSHCLWEMLAMQFRYPALREINNQTPLFEVGKIAKASLTQILGRCVVFDAFEEQICRLNPRLCDLIFEVPEIDDLLDPVCLSCPPLESVELAVLGSMYRNLEPLSKKIKNMFSVQKKKSTMTISIDKVENLLNEGAEKGIKLVSKNLKTGMKKLEKVL